jgi:ADP-dependent NAD(P)H-hydrate dehydratase / NAD(P)H-hydrate epimerase
MQKPIKKMYSTESVRAFEADLYSKAEVQPAELMSRAARAVCSVLLEHWPGVQKIIILCGCGNNAGDGYALATILHQQGLEVSVIALESDDKMSGLASKTAQAAQSAGVLVRSYQSDDVIPTCDLLVDAILGLGQSRPLCERYADLVNAANAHSAPILSIDIPSGINADSGRVWGCAIVADLTVTLLLPKAGLFTSEGLVHAGKVVFDDLEMQPAADVQPTARAMDWSMIRNKLPLRALNAHKGDFGHVLVIGGDYGMGGAVRLASESAVRLGAGKVSVATRPEHVCIVSDCPELMCHQVSSLTDLIPLLATADVIVVGPGLGQSDWSKMLWQAVKDTNIPMVVDADALNLLSKNPIKHDNWILTPHPGEAARMLGSATDAVQSDRFAALKALNSKYGGVCVLKGAGSLLGSEAELTAICRAGNPGMASGGMGDLLSGIIAALLAQQLSLQDAAEVGVLLHASAADVAASEDGERGMSASDVLKYARQLANPERRN